MSTQFNFLFGGSPAQPPLRPDEYLPPRSRTHDPASSKRAEAEIKRSGVMRGQQTVALKLVTENPGRTAAQLAEIHSPFDEVVRFKTMIFLRKRLPELREMKLVDNHGPDGVIDVSDHDQRWWAK